MSLLKFERSQIVALVENGLMNKATIMHYDICKAILSGETQEKIAERFGLSEDRVVRLIRDKKCPECH